MWEVRQKELYKNFERTKADLKKIKDSDIELKKTVFHTKNEVEFWQRVVDETARCVETKAPEMVSPQTN